MSAQIGSNPQGQVVVNESDDWQNNYRDPQLVGRRIRTHRRKMERLGVFTWPRNIKLLDLCCGSGEALRIMREAGFTNLHGADVTIDDQIKREPWVSLSVCDGRSLPYPDQEFEAIVCMHSLHHLGGVEGIRRTLNEAKRVLKPGGYLSLVDHYNAPQVWLAFWGVRQWWLTWPTSGLRSFHKQHIEEWPYLSEYIRTFADTRKVIEDLGFTPVVDRKGAFFFYWTGRK
ncbi:MAG TPA: methyltransferase domain-containing protein [Planctomycetota bacterium]|nr:methyltransferase domain-containing protein [Planctomycetota bacterium]